VFVGFLKDVAKDVKANKDEAQSCADCGHNDVGGFDDGSDDDDDSEVEVRTMIARHKQKTVQFQLWKRRQEPSSKSNVVQCYMLGLNYARV